ncbi:MAG: DUF1330 domain-containing protein [Gammaproteobacteria bacterium]|nr:DUF1330 domain-containing protein [Gammaproteobacteria bacterium]
MAAYVIFNYKILDRSKIDELTERVKPVDKKYGAEVIVGSPVKAVEGETLPNMVIYQFKSFQDATDWYYSEEHQDVSLFRQAITEGWVTIVPGVDETEALVSSGYFECKS